MPVDDLFSNCGCEGGGGGGFCVLYLLLHTLSLIAHSNLFCHEGQLFFSDICFRLFLELWTLVPACLSFFFFFFFSRKGLFFYLTLALQYQHSVPALDGWAKPTQNFCMNKQEGFSIRIDPV